LRINTYFDILLGQRDPQVVFDPDQIGGTLGTLRDTYGIYFSGNPFNNSVEDEQDITNFRMISDYMTSLLQSWIANRDFFRLASRNPAFFGTQLVLISRQFNVIIETVNEVRFTLDSVFIGPNERQTLLLEFNDSQHFPPMFLEDVLGEVEKFATDEGPRLLRDGGKISVTNNLLPVVDTLAGLVDQAHNPANAAALPDGYRTARVQKSLDDLEDQLNALATLIQQVEQRVPSSEDRLEISGVNPVSGSKTTGAPQQFVVSVYGEGFQPGSGVTLTQGSVSLALSGPRVVFYSAQRIDATLDLTSGAPPPGAYDVTVSNPSGDSITLPGGFQVTNGGGSIKNRNLSFDLGGGGGNAARSVTATATSTPTASDAANLKDSIDQLQRSNDNLQQNYEKLSQKLDDMWDKMKGFFEGDGGDKKNKTK
jgi:hypothetical protein